MTPFELVIWAFAATVSLSLLSIGLSLIAWGVSYGWRRGKEKD